MDNKALYDFINEACKQDDTDIDISIAELTSAIHTLEKERDKRESLRKQNLIDNFKMAFNALREANVDIICNFNIDYVMEEVDEAKDWRDNVILEMDDIKSFTFN